MDEISNAKQLISKVSLLKAEISKIIVGQEDAVESVLISILAGGHSLLIGVPGLAKTLLVNTIAQALDLDFKRIQFTPDLMPSDIIGTEILDRDRNLRFVKGPIFANIILADEINRTPPKTQAALLESMQEQSVSVAGESYRLENPFFVLATQNPIEQEGTYPLPEAQLDRFMFSIYLDYPNFAQEVEIVKRNNSSTKPQIQAILNRSDIAELKNLIDKIPVTDSVIEYAVSLVSKSRPRTSAASEVVNKYLDWGAGPRASQNLISAAKIGALLDARFTPEPSDVRKYAKAVLQHRIIKNYKAEAEGFTEQMIIESLF